MSMNSFHARGARSKPKPRPTAAPRTGIRADQLLVQQGLAGSRTAARRLIEAGRVKYDHQPLLKPAQMLTPEVVLQLDPATDYVSRGGHKLAHALQHSGVIAAHKICLDIGQSTGGFSDCLLQHGAERIIGVDVGHGQLHPDLVADLRVQHFEGINARQLEAGMLPLPSYALIVVDVSFISLTLIMPQLPALLSHSGDILALVKPQFEVGPDHLGKNGIVVDRTLYVGVREKLSHCCASLNLAVRDWFDSPITGSDGNHEFFIHVRHEY